MMDMNIYQKTVNNLGIKIANLEMQNASMLAELEVLKASSEETENKENDDNVTNK